MSEMSFSTSLLKDSFAGYESQGTGLFVFGTEQRCSTAFLTVFHTECVVILKVVLLDIMHLFFYGCFKIFSLSLVLRNLIIMCLVVLLDGFVKFLLYMSLFFITFRNIFGF